MFRGVKALLLCQVDDFALANPDKDIAKAIYVIIVRRLMLPGEDNPPFANIGLVNCWTILVATAIFVILSTILRLMLILSMQLCLLIFRYIIDNRYDIDRLIYHWYQLIIFKRVRRSNGLDISSSHALQENCLPGPTFTCAISARICLSMTEI